MDDNSKSDFLDWKTQRITKTYFASVQEKIFELMTRMVDMPLEDVQKTQGAIQALTAILEIDFAEEASNAD